MKKVVTGPPVLALAVIAGGIGLVHFAAALPWTPLHFKHSPIHVLRNHDATLARGRRGEMISKNWSGYFVARYQSGETYTSAQLTWVVPGVSYGQSSASVPSDEVAANWVGIGGTCEDARCTSNDETLIQLGTTEQVSPSGETRYYAWYETLPQAETTITMTIRPGDTVLATLSCGDTCAQNPQTWTLTMQDGAQSWSKQVRYGSSLLSAEWIEEAPADRGIQPLADFGASVFAATGGVNGQTPSLTVAENAMQMKDPWGQTANPSSPTTLGQFNVCWGFETTATCATP